MPEVAKALGVSARTVQYWARDGMPKTDDGNYDLIEIQTWRHMRNVGANNGKNPFAQMSSYAEKEKWETEYRKYRAKMAELAYLEQEGALVRRDAVERESVEKILAVKKALLAIPKSLAPLLVGLDVLDMQVIIQEKIEEIITDFAGGQNKSVEDDIKNEAKTKKQI